MLLNCHLQLHRLIGCWRPSKPSMQLPITPLLRTGILNMFIYFDVFFVGEDYCCVNENSITPHLYKSEKSCKNTSFNTTYISSLALIACLFIGEFM